METSHPSRGSTKIDKEDHDLLVKESRLDLENDDSESCCTICLQAIVDRTVIPKCSHEFCFECLLVWTEQSRRCPLCSQSMGDHLIHSIRSRYDYRKHYLAPMPTSPSPGRVHVNNARRARRRHQAHVWGTRTRDADEEADKLGRSISKRRWIYKHDLYTKHVASNPFTKYRPYPTPAQFSASPDLISRTTTFLRRELQVWENLDVEFLTTIIISLMKSIDIRSESAVKLISEFLDMDASHSSRSNAEHLAHEIYSYVRSPYRDLFVYDSVVQYESPPDVPSPPNNRHERNLKWHHRGRRRPLSPLQSDLAPRSCRSSEMDRNWPSRSRSRSPVRNRITFRSVSSEKSEDKGGIKRDAIDSDCGEGHDLDSCGSGTSRPMDCIPKRSVSVASNDKGKAPPDISTPSHPHGGNETSDLHIESFTSTPPTVELPACTIKMRPPRHKTLRESINSHLGRTTARVDPAPTGSPIRSRDPLSDSNQLEPLRPNLQLGPSDSSQGDQTLQEAANSEMILDVVEARARLLARLNREKRQVELCVDPPTGSSPSLKPPLEEREAKLRLQAQLRARVAAEKRLVASA